MGEKSWPESGVDTLEKAIRAELEGRRRRLRVEDGSLSEDMDIQMIRARLAIAQKQADVGLKIPPMAQFPRLMRPIALAAGRLVAYLSSFITEDQRKFNHCITGVLKEMADCVEAAKKNQAKIEKDMQRLKEMLEELNERPCPR